MALDHQECDHYANLPGAVLVVGSDEIVFANRRAEAIFGYDAGELIGLPLYRLVPAPQRQQHARFIEEFHAHPAVRSMNGGREVEGLKRDGDVIPLEIAIGPVDGGRAVALVHDISAIVKGRDELRGALAEVTRLNDRLAAEPRYLEQEIRVASGVGTIVGRSTAIQSTLDKLARVAATDAPVLLLGESGTGKELIAWTLHGQSLRRDRPLIKVDCTTLSADLVESTLFGHDKGAFTGAHRTVLGRFELADHGTVFLDEVGELPLSAQAKLLRVLQDGQFERVGSGETRRVDVRIVAATNRNLRREVDEGRFRLDLYYRLSVFPLEVPPLRDRQGDIPLLLEFFVARYARKHGRAIDRIEPSIMAALERYSWPGNVRELDHLVERAVIMCEGTTLDLVPPIPHQPLPEQIEAARGSARPDPAARAHGLLAGIERAAILRTLEECQWRVKGARNAAERLGLNPSTLRARMKKLGIVRPNPRET